MNLSALNKLANNGLAPTTNEALPSANALARLSSGAISGADFASFLHNQVQALKSNERQHLAADHGKLPQREEEKPAKSNTSDNRSTRTRTGQQPADQTAIAASGDEDKPVNDSQDSASTDAIADHKADANPDNTSSDLPKGQTLSDAVNAQAKALSEQKNQSAQTSVDDQDSGTEPTIDKALVGAQTTDNSAMNPTPSAQLTTIALSDKLQIITASQAAPNEKSLADFALSMGLEPSQVKALFGQTSVPTPTAKTGISTQDLLALNNAPSQNANNPLMLNPVNSLLDSKLTENKLPANLLTTPVSSADFQALQQVSQPQTNVQDADLLSKMNNLQLQVGTAAAQLATTAPPPSTLSVLSMMDAQLRSEDIESLKAQFDDLQVTASGDNTALTTPTTGPVQSWRSGNPTSAQATAPAFANQPDMAQTYENLSQKLSTELAARMHEKLNAGEWKMKFALKPASLGLVDVQLEMRDGKLTAQFQSDTAFTQDLIQNGSQKLKDALADLGLNNTAVMVGQGQSQSASQSGQGGQHAPGTLAAKRVENNEKLTGEPGPEIAKGSETRRNKRSQFDSYA